MADPRPNVGGGRFSAAGVSGLKRFQGFLFEEWLVELQGAKGRRVLTEMASNDPIIGAILFSLEMMIRQVDWRVDPGTDDAAGEAAAQFIDEALHDMSITWPDQLSEILSFLTYGWAFHEVIYKKRDGTTSQYTDGKIGWRSWPIRGQESLLKWEFDDAGDILAMVQLGAPDYKIHVIPMEKSLLFRTTLRMNNPEGRSVLRSAYTSYVHKKHIQIIEGIGIERDLAGFPVMKVPGSIMQPDRNGNEQEAFSNWKSVLRNIKRDEQEGLMIPSDVDPTTHHKLYEFELLKGGGTRQFDTDAIIGRYDQRIAMTVMADFIMLGHEKVGSNALAQQKGKMFQDALGAWLQMITAVVNDVAIPRLLKINGMDAKNPPTLEHGDIEGSNLDTLGTLMYNLAQAGFELDKRADGELLTDILAKAKLPQPPEDIDVSQPDDAAAQADQAKQEALDAAADAKPEPAVKPGKPATPGRKAASEPQDERELMLAALDAKFGETLASKKATRNGH